MSSVSSSSVSEDSDIDEEEDEWDGAPRLSTTEEGLGTTDLEDILRREERELIVTSGSEFRQFAFELVESKCFSFGILTVIILNTIFIGVQTSEYVLSKSEWYLMMVDQLFLAIYIMELVLKLYVWRLKYFQQPWNIFDFTIVVASLVDFFIPLIVQNLGAFDARIFRVLRVLRAIRALRALRVLRTIRFLKNLQIIVSTVLQSIPALGSIVILISLVLYIFAIIGRGLYSEVDPERYGDIGRASFTLFQLITLDDWFYMYSDVRDRYPDHQHILVYLLLFIILETFIFINLFVAVIVDNLARTQAAANAAKPKVIHGLHKHKHVDHESDLDVTAGPSRQHRGTVVSTIQHSVEDYYDPETHSEKERELLGHYFTVLASLDHHMYTIRNHQHSFNELIDLVDFSKI